ARRESEAGAGCVARRASRWLSRSGAWCSPNRGGVLAQGALDRSLQVADRNTPGCSERLGQSGAQLPRALLAAAGPLASGAPCVACRGRTPCCGSGPGLGRRWPTAGDQDGHEGLLSRIAPIVRVIEHRQGFFLEFDAIFGDLKFTSQPRVFFLKL